MKRLITFGKRRDLHARRQVLRVIHNESVVAKLFGPLADRYADRPGGYTRIVRVGHRQGDAAEMSILELIDREGAADDQADEKADENSEEKNEETAEEEETALKRPARRKSSVISIKQVWEKEKAATRCGCRLFRCRTRDDARRAASSRLRPTATYKASVVYWSSSCSSGMSTNSG